MKWFSSLLSFRGRLNRAPFWKLLFVWMFIFALVFGRLLFNLEDLSDLEFILWMLAVIPVLWPFLAFQAKRWHDVNRSAWWVLSLFVPVLGWVVLVVCGFYRGTKGSNRYGDDPLESKGAELGGAS